MPKIGYNFTAMEIELEINGQTIRAREGATIMQVAAQMGLYIPHFCYHPKLSIAANCRMCLVEVEKSPKPLPACATVALDGMVVRLDSPKAKEAQNSVMEFLLINHPLDCPICDQGGECQLQDLAVGYGVSKSRYTEEKRVVFEKNLGPLISTDMTRCIHCTRCVRFGREIGGMMELGMAGRGEHAEIMPFIEQTVDSELSGNMIDVCPVGALTSKPFRFTARPWELTPKPGLSPHDSWGSHLFLQTKGAEVKRVVPRANDSINQCWIADRDRFSYLGVSANDRALMPLWRSGDAEKLTDCSWQEVLFGTAQTLKKYAGQQIGFLASPSATAEELFLWQKMARALGCDNIDSRLRQRDFSAEAPSDFGFRIADIHAAGSVLLIGVDPAREQPLLSTHFRRAKRRLMSIGALDIGGQVPLAAQHIVRPSQIGAVLAHINRALGLSAVTDLAVDALKDESANIQLIVQKLTAAKGDKHIVFGDSIIGAPDFGKILHEATLLARGTNASLGALSAGANGAGARRLGVFPQNGGMSVSAMLRADMDAIMLLGCEWQDFAESAAAAKMLGAAKFVGALTPFVGDMTKYAHAVLPMATFGENDGTFINGEGVAQTFAAAVAPPGQSRPGWKILRVLGEMLGLAEFDFDDLDDVRAMMPQKPSSAPALMSESAPTFSPKSFELVGGTPIYDVDMIVRRASALQITAQGKKAAYAFLHPDDMAQCGLAEGDGARLGDGAQVWETRAFADSRLARGAILAYPPNLSPVGINVEAIVAEGVKR